MPGSRIIGIDPGLGKTGWAVMEALEGELSLLEAGVVVTSPKASISSRLMLIHEQLSATINKYKPLQGAMEKIFVNMNPKSSLKLAYARGAILLSASLNGLELAEYEPNLIKSAITGNGHASKEQVHMMLARQIRSATDIKSKDAADALAIALCHYNAGEMISIYGENLARIF